ncbi:MAG TPA: 16S rRNA (adenine(1518)-N(6)/adenine(1519)-N(6))-dimethyltransferase RsmA [Fimbriimonadaceae bacterium]|nr:16S rRNA (adenine(1518)-N(6)/adenine(1519)-N(6))-dimethyltransferase RsmA [Fimbriimonadaceae bacterium]
MNLADPATLKSLLSKYGLDAKKRLGQHFLISSKVVESIVDSVGDVQSVVEIGPGPGVLTSPLATRYPTVVALEVDSDMMNVLAESAPTAEVRNTDALKTDLSDVLGGLPAPRAVVSNLPYYITGPLLDRITSASEKFDRAILMMQREVGEKLLAQPGDRDRGALTVRMEAAFDVSRVCLVPKGAFLPPPKVESIVLRLESRPSSDSEGFFKFVRAGFKQPRKTLANNLRAAGYESPNFDQLFGLPSDVRPQVLTLEQWRALFAHFR